jgi:hypothetical protein
VSDLAGKLGLVWRQSSVFSWEFIFFAGRSESFSYPDRAQQLKGTGMAYFPRNMRSIERGAKVLADTLVALLLLVFSIVFFGMLGGLAGFIVLEAALLGVDHLMPDDDDSAGAGVR